MADVVYLLGPGYGLDLFDKGGQVVGAHFLPTKLPELLIFWVQLDVFLRPLVASVIAKPDIITLRCKDKAWSLSGQVANPNHVVVRHAMLEKHNGLFGTKVFLFIDLAGYSVKRKDVAIISGHLVLLSSETILIGQLLDGFECIRTIIFLLSLKVL